MDPVQVLIWVVIVVFATTAIITLGGLVENFKYIQIKEEYLKKLFVALILEIIAVCIPLSSEAIRESRCGEDCMAERIANLDPTSKLAQRILEMRDTFSGIFKTPEYTAEISFDDFEHKDDAKVCPQTPLYRSNVMVFNQSRSGGVLVIPVKPDPNLCSNEKLYRIVISREWAEEEFKVIDHQEKLTGWCRVVPPTLEL